MPHLGDINLKYFHEILRLSLHYYQAKSLVFQEDNLTRGGHGFRWLLVNLHRCRRMVKRARIHPEKSDSQDGVAAPDSGQPARDARGGTRREGEHAHEATFERYIGI